MITFLVVQVGGGQEEVYRLHKFKAWTFGDVRKIHVVGGFLFIGKEDGVKVLNLITLTDSVRGVKLPEYLTGERPSDIVFSKRTMYVAFNTRTTPEIDVVDFGTGELKSSFPTGGTIINMAVGGRYLFVLTSLGLEIYDISNPTDPKEAGNVPFSNFTGTSMKVALPYLYVSTGRNGLMIFKVEGGKVRRVAQYIPPDSSPVIDAEPYGNYIYLACAKGGLKVVGIDRSGNLQLLGEVKTRHPVFALRRYKKFLIAMFGSNGVKIYSIARPSSPLLSAYYTNGQYLYDAGAYGKYLVLAYGPGGVITFKSPIFR